MKRYRLKYDTIPPSWVHIKLCAGTIIELDGNRYIDPISKYHWAKDAVESNEWFFEEIHDIPEQAKEGFVWTDELAVEFMMKNFMFTSLTKEELIKQVVPRFKASKQSLSNTPKQIESKEWTELSDSFRGMAHGYKDGKFDYRHIFEWFQNQQQHYDLIKKTSNTPKEELLDLANPNPKYSFSPSYQPKEEQPSKEKEWEIVAYFVDGRVWQKVPLTPSDGTCRWGSGLDRMLDEAMLASSPTIHSVRRLSDGDVFSVGDELDGTGYSNCKISSIVLYKDAPYPVLKYNDDKCSVSIYGGSKKLPSNKPSEQPTKEDGFSLPSGVNKVISSTVAGNCVFYTIQNNDGQIYMYKHDIATNKTVQLEKFPAPDTFEKTYTQEQLYKAIVDAFNAARERKYIKDPSIRTISDHQHDFLYKSAESYLSSIKKQIK